MSMTDLRLGALGKAVGVNTDTTSQTKLAETGRGSTGTETKMSDFGMTATSVTLSDSTPDEGTGYSDFATGTFTNAGSLVISRIASIAANFTWTEASNGSFFNLLGHGAAYEVNCIMGAVTTNTLCAVGYKFHDGYNVNAGGYNQLQSAQFTILNTGARSDIRWKQNIERVGTSQLGLPIFEFEYIDPTHGKGRYRGTIAQELIKNDYAHATILDIDGYFWVDYSKIDIPFESC